MGNTFWQAACILAGFAWAISGDSTAAAAWFAASVVISRIGKK